MRTPIRLPSPGLDAIWRSWSLFPLRYDAGFFTIVGIFAVSAELARLLSRTERTWSFVIAFYIAPAFLVLGLFLLLFIRQRIHDTLRSLRRAVRIPYRRQQLDRHARRILGSSTANAYGIGFGLVGVGMVYAMDPPIDGVVLRPLFYLFVLYFFLVSGFGLGAVVSTLQAVCYLPRLVALRPSAGVLETEPLRAMASLSSLLAVSFSIATLGECLMFFAMPWRNAAAERVVVLTVMATVWVVAAATFVVPAVVIGRMLRSHRSKAARTIEREIRMGRLANPGERTVELTRLYSLFADSSTRPFDWPSIWRFVSSIAIVGLGLWLKNERHSADVFEAIRDWFLR